VLLALLCRGRRPALTILLVVMRAALAQPADNPAMKMSGVKRKGQRLNPSGPATDRNQSAIPSMRNSQYCSALAVGCITD
jgi:hypothetical protein